MVRNVYVTAVPSGRPGMMNVEFQDTFDLTPGGREPLYNIITGFGGARNQPCPQRPVFRDDRAVSGNQQKIPAP